MGLGKEIVLAIAARTTVLGMLIIIKGIVGDLAEVAAAEDEVAEGKVEGA